MKSANILIGGLPKSGTTALFFKILNSYPKLSFGLFEPINHNEIYKSLSQEQIENLIFVSKILIREDDCTRYNIAPHPQVNYDSFKHYNKKVFMIRDPRDNLISYMLFSIPCGIKLIEPENVGQVISLIERKEADPQSVSVLDIFRFMNSLNQSDFIKLFLKRQDFSVKYLDNNKDYFILKYEDLIANRISELEEYLSISLKGDAKVHKTFSNVERTKSSGDWKNWFLQEDIDYFKPLFLGYMKKYNYPEDWNVNDNPLILSKYGSEYVKINVKDFHVKYK